LQITYLTDVLARQKLEENSFDLWQSERVLTSSTKFLD